MSFHFYLPVMMNNNVYNVSYLSEPIAQKLHLSRSFKVVAKWSFISINSLTKKRTKNIGFRRILKHEEALFLLLSV